MVNKCEVCKRSVNSAFQLFKHPVEKEWNVRNTRFVDKRKITEERTVVVQDWKWMCQNCYNKAVWGEPVWYKPKKDRPKIKWNERRNYE